ncbi:MAG: hypothetical protein ACOC44_08445 [Promethearchaeia archaeon]
MKNLNNVQKEKKREEISEDPKLEIPPVPAPKKKPPIPINKDKIPEKFREDIKKLKTQEKNPILIKCQRCQKYFLISIPKKDLNFSEKKSLAIVYVHQGEEENEKHALLFEVDRAYNISLIKSADVIITSKDKQYINKEEKKQVHKVVGVYCRECEALVHLHVPKKVLKNNPLPKVPVVYIHKKKKKQNAHGLIVFIDRNTAMRDNHLADVLIGG